MILTSVELDNEKLSRIEVLLSSVTVRNYFASILYQDKFNLNKFQVLNEKGFDDLNYIIFHCLLLCNNDVSQYNDIMLITKSSFYYYK